VDVLCKRVYNFIHACMSSTNEVGNFVAGKAWCIS